MTTVHAVCRCGAGAVVVLVVVVLTSYLVDTISVAMLVADEI